jgi:hypothetical protein
MSSEKVEGAGPGLGVDGGEGLDGPAGDVGSVPQAARNAPNATGVKARIVGSSKVIGWTSDCEQRRLCDNPGVRPPSRRRALRE